MWSTGWPPSIRDVMARYMLLHVLVVWAASPAENNRRKKKKDRMPIVNFTKSQTALRQKKKKRKQTQYATPWEPMEAVHVGGLGSIFFSPMLSFATVMRNYTLGWQFRPTAVPLTQLECASNHDVADGGALLPS